MYTEIQIKYIKIETAKGQQYSYSGSFFKSFLVWQRI